MENCMSPKIDFVVIGSEESCVITDFGYRPLIFAKALSRSGYVGKVLVINCPVSFLGRMAGILRRRGRVEDVYPVKIKKVRYSVVKMDAKLSMLNLSSIFPDSGSLFSRIDSGLHAKNITRVLNELGFSDFILWIASPRMVDMAAKIHSTIKVFDAIDNLLAHPQMSRSYGRIKKSYRWVDDNADLICIAAEGQRKMFTNSSKLFLLPNCVDSVFLDAKKSEMPFDVKDVAKPTAGYVGVLQERMDVQLIEETAKRLPDVNFVFVGPIKSKPYFEILMKYRNIHFLGIKRYSEIPDYIRYFDVCIIPHKVNEFTNSMDPLKIYEYLACGKPIVSTPVAGTERFKEHIYLAKTPAEFADALKRAFSTDSEKMSADRISLALKHSWDNAISNMIETKVLTAGEER